MTNNRKFQVFWCQLIKSYQHLRGLYCFTLNVCHSSWTRRIRRWRQNAFPTFWLTIHRLTQLNTFMNTSCENPNLADGKIFKFLCTKGSFLFKYAYKFAVGRSQGEVRRTEKGFMRSMENFVNTSWL